MNASEAKRLRALENENSRLKRMLADSLLDKAVVNDWLGKKCRRPPQGGKPLVISSGGTGSERRAYKATGLSRMSMGYPARRADYGLPRGRMIELAQERRRFGYRPLHVRLHRKGFEISHKQLFRIYPEERRGVRLRGGRERAIGTRAPM